MLRTYVRLKFSQERFYFEHFLFLNRNANKQYKNEKPNLARVGWRDIFFAVSVNVIVRNIELCQKFIVKTLYTPNGNVKMMDLLQR